MVGGILGNNMGIISCRWNNSSKAANSMMLMVILITLMLCCNINCSSSSSAEEGVRLELIHMHSVAAAKGKQWRQPNQQLERLKDLVERDGIRYQAIHVNRLRRGRRRQMTSIEMPMRSGADYGAGQYLVSFKVGTPAQPLLLIADTGSELTWMNCRKRCGRQRRHRRTPRHRRVFCADYSSSFTTFPCSSPRCKVDLMNLFSLARCPTPFTPCAYDYRYADGSAAVGIFGEDTTSLQLSNGRKAKLSRLLVGCSEVTRGETLELSDGVLGLGYSNHSFAMKASEMFGGKFSYCLVDHLSPRNVSNYLVFGSSKSSSMQYTPLALGVIGSLYAIHMEGISVGGVKLNIPNQIWDVNGAGGTIVDSGTSLTVLSRPAYKPVIEALWIPLSSKYKRLVDLEIGAAMEYCFNSTGFEERVVPRLEFHLGDGVGFRPPVKNYVIDAAEGVKCLGILSADWPSTSVIGNIMQQNHIWEFDLINHRLGFSPSTCT